MKKLSLIIMLSLCSLFGYSQTYTNGVFIKDGITTEIEKKVYSSTPTNSPEVFCFSNDLNVKVYTNSDFSVNSFFQEVYDLDKPPHKSKFGNSNFAATLMKGTMVATYSGGDSNSSCVISTPMVDIELHKGSFYFKVTENKVLVFVLEGSLTSHSGKNKENVVTAGYAVIAVPNDIGILEDKISVGAEKVKQIVIDKLSGEIKDISNLKDGFIFATINGKRVGIVLN